MMAAVPNRGSSSHKNNRWAPTPMPFTSTSSALASGQHTKPTGMTMMKQQQKQQKQIMTTTITTPMPITQQCRRRQQSVEWCQCMKNMEDGQRDDSVHMRRRRHRSQSLLLSVATVLLLLSCFATNGIQPCGAIRGALFRTGRSLFPMMSAAPSAANPVIFSEGNGIARAGQQFANAIDTVQDEEQLDMVAHPALMYDLRQLREQFNHQEDGAADALQQQQQEEQKRAGIMPTSSANFWLASPPPSLGPFHPKQQQQRKMPSNNGDSVGAGNGNEGRRQPSLVLLQREHQQQRRQQQQQKGREAGGGGGGAVAIESPFYVSQAWQK